jgi:predicted nucleic acid-binding protein
MARVVSFSRCCGCLFWISLLIGEKLLQRVTHTLISLISVLATQTEMKVCLLNQDMYDSLYIALAENNCCIEK